MGRFSTTVQIKNNADRMRFINSFCDVMKKRGFVPCSEDETALSYLLAFGEGGWGTLTSEEYKNNPQKAYDDSREMAEILKTSAFSVEVVDSDFALLKLCNSDGGEDKVVVGDGSGYGVDNAEGTRELWEPLLTDGITWEQFSETAAKNEVFVEDTLAELAEVLGIEPCYICTDFDEVLNRADENENITAFSFKKAAAKAKSMSLNAAFVKVFGEALEPLGFKKIKGRYPYFVRLIGNEIIHVITYRKAAGHPDVDGYVRLDYGQYEILGGVATVYRAKMDPGDIGLLNNSEIYKIHNYFDVDSDDRASIMYFPFKTGDDKQIIGSFQHAFDVTKQNLLAALDEAESLGSCMDFFCKYYPGHMTVFNYRRDRFDKGNHSEGLLQIKTDSPDSYFEREIKYRRLEIDRSECWGATKENIDLRRKSLNDFLPTRKNQVLEMYSDTEWCNNALAELERRRKANIEILREWGLDL